MSNYPRQQEKQSVSEISAKALSEVMLKDAPQGWEGLTEETLGRFGVRKQNDGTAFPYMRHGALVGYKIRRDTEVHEQRFYAVGDCQDVELYGQHLCSGKGTLVVTEGEKDCMSAWQMTGHDCVSIPTGAMADKKGQGVIHKGVKAQEDFLRGYDTVHLCLDQDQPGQAVAEAMAVWLGESTRIVRFGMKDANEMLQAGAEEEFRYSVSKAAKYKPQRVLTPSDLVQELLNPPPPGLPYPWPTLNELMGGMRMGEVIGWGAGVKVGKTNSAMQLSEHIVTDLEEKVGLFYLENTPLSTLQNIAAKFLKDISLAQGAAFTTEQTEEITKLLDDRMFIYDHRGSKEWSVIKNMITWLCVSEGVRFFFIDPITAMVPGDASAGNAFQMELFRDMTSLAIQLDCHINFYSHLNPPGSGVPHEEGGRVQAIQMTGSRAPIRWAHGLIGIERNVMAQGLQRNTSMFRVLLNRWNGQTGQFPVYFNEHTGAYLEDLPGDILV